MVIISCRPFNLIEEAERSSRLSGASARSLLGRVLLLNSTQGDLVPLFQLADASTRNILRTSPRAGGRRAATRARGNAGAARPPARSSRGTRPVDP